MKIKFEAFSKERQALDELYDVAGNIKNLKDDYIILKSALTELKHIKEAEPSEAMVCLENVWNDINEGNDFRNDFKDLSVIRNVLLKAQEQEKAECMGGRFSNKSILHLKNAIEQCNDQALYYASKSFGNKYIVPRKEYEELRKNYIKYEIILKCIEEKNVDTMFLKDCNTVEEYNKYCDDITDEKPLTEEEFTLLKFFGKDTKVRRG